MAYFYVDNDQPQVIEEAVNDTTIYDSLPDMHDPVPRKVPEADKQMKQVTKAINKLIEHIDILIPKLEALRDTLEECELLDISEGMK